MPLWRMTTCLFFSGAHRHRVRIVMALLISNFSWKYPSSPEFSLSVEMLSIARGEAIYLSGPSGCGKSTFLGILAGTLRTILDPARRAVFGQIAFVMHQTTLAPWLRLEQNVKLEERLRGVEADWHLMLSLLREFELDWSKCFTLFPRELSFGMRQRFELAKAIAFRPNLLLLDEGFSGIGGSSREAVIAAVGRMVDQFDTAVVFTSHNVMDGLRLADHVVRIRDGTFARAIPMTTRRIARAGMSPAELFSCPDSESVL